MAGSRPPGVTPPDPTSSKLPGRTPGPLGRNDAGDPNARALPGDTPGPLGTSGDAGSFTTSPPRREPVRYGYAGAVLIEQRPDLFYSPKESPTFDKLFAQATAIKAKIAPNADMKADDAATYDPEYNVILLNTSDFENKHVRSRTQLHQSTAHELVHAVQNKSILEKAPDPKERAALLDQAILRWKTEEAFVKHHLEKEIQAETIAQ